MNNNKKKLLFVLSFPIFCLLTLTVYKALKLQLGAKITIPISGYDPRDLLSGHYLVYQIDYNPLNSVCDNQDRYQDRTVYMCVRASKDSRIESEFFYNQEDTPDKGCTVKIAGKCNYHRFVANIERFYIPEEHAPDLDTVIRDKKGKIIVSVDPAGKAMVKELLIEDKPWLEYLRQKKNK
jgi:uncharacterized membrane-anchored protein